MKRREMKLLLEERFERIALLETRIDTMDQLVEGYRAREQSVLNALQAAKENAAKALEHVQAEGEQIRKSAQQTLAEAEQTRLNARAEAEALLSDAISAANTLKAEAERRAVEETASVKADSERMLRDAEIIKREYEEMVDSFNAMLEQNASELEITAARFAEFVKNRKIDRAEARLDGNAFYKSVGELSDAALPDASEDPSLLMQNIYRIQNRPLPEDRMESASAQEPEPALQPEQQEDAPYVAMLPVTQAKPTEPDAPQSEPAPIEPPKFPIEDGSGADERKNAEDPYSEAAWANESLQSEREPQAEFVKTFDDAFVKSDYTVHDEECNITQADAESEFDALMSNGAPLAGAAAVAIPTVAALASENLAPEPMADAARAFDAYFDETFEPSGKTAQDEVPADQATEPEGAAPEPEASPERVSNEEAQAILDTLPEPGASAERDSTSPEPYSAQAWSRDSFTSDLEPQAEGALFTEQDIATSAPVRTGDAVEQPSSSSDAERAFDDYLAGIGVITATAPTKPVEEVPEPMATAEPYSAQAWSRDSFASDLEPQAEGTLFTEQDIATSAPVRTGDAVEQPSSSSDAERAFDDYLAGIGAIAATAPTKPVEAAPEQAATAEPYSARSWSHESFTSDLEPQAEGALFGEPETESKAPVNAYSDDTQQPPISSDAERAFDDYLAGIGATTPAAKPEPEPYSKQAWSNEPYTSELEPHAEAASYPSADEPEEEEEPKPAPRRYNEYGEIREWEPEPEPDMGDVPTVSRYMGQANSEDEISLDDLLDEIIKAGD
ncbi:MAG: hypothetical protein ABFC56_07645 [Clostridiaceae bacterium]